MTSGIEAALNFGTRDEAEQNQGQSITEGNQSAVDLGDDLQITPESNIKEAQLKISAQAPVEEAREEVQIQKGNVEEELHVKWKNYLKASLQRDYILFNEI